MTKGSKRICTGIVTENREVRPCYWRLEIQFVGPDAAAFSALAPGQFAEIDLSGLSLPDISDKYSHLNDISRKNIILRRPFSFYRAEKTPEGFELGLLYCVLGPATLRMTTLQSGDKLSVIGPLGNGFTVPEGLKHAILVAGGMGAPPLQHLGQFLTEKYPGVKVTAFVGARSVENLPYFHITTDTAGNAGLEEFSRYSIDCCLATDDGSAGFKGLVTQAAEQYIRQNNLSADETIIYACGPEIMLAAAAKIASSLGIPCQVSMERMMGCGIGLCQSCAVKSAGSDEYKMCCKDGPVFESTEVEFKI